MKDIICLLIIFEIIITIGIGGYIPSLMKTGEFYTFNAVGRFIKKLFTNKNLFGIFINLIVSILSLPAILCVIVIGIILLAISLLIEIYSLGNKKDNE